jgi:hypothetical protein
MVQARKLLLPKLKKEKKEDLAKRNLTSNGDIAMNKRVRIPPSAPHRNP